MVLKKLTFLFYNFHLVRVWSSQEDLFSMIFTLGGCGGYIRATLDELYFGRVWWSCKD